MKTAILTFCLLTAGSVFAQTLVGGSGLSAPTSSQLNFPSHQRRAEQHPLGQTQTILEEYTVTSAQGDRPLWEFAAIDNSTPLGDVARILRKEHESAPKATFIFDKE